MTKERAGAVCRSGGAASHLVFLHGQPGGGADWDQVIAALPPRLASTALDRPGYRSNPMPAGTFLDNARWVVDNLDQAGIGDAVLIGHSYGGAIALTAAALAPARVRGLVLVASVGPDCLDGWDAILSSAVGGEICAVSAWLVTPWFARRRLARISRKLQRPLRPDEHVSWEAWGSARHEHGAMWRTFLTEQRELTRGLDELTAGLAKITVPTLILADESDKMIPVATPRALHDLIPGARLELLRRGGHNLPRRAAAEVAGYLTDFVDALDETDSAPAG